MSVLKRYTGEYGYDIVVTANEDISSATGVVIKAKHVEDGITKTLSGTVSPSTVFTATVPEDFFDMTGIWLLQLQVTFASAVRYQQTPTKIEIEEGFNL